MPSNLDKNLEFLKQNYSFLISVCMDKASRLVWMDRWGANKLFAQLDSAAAAAAATAARKAAMETRGGGGLRTQAAGRLKTAARQ